MRLRIAARTALTTAITPAVLWPMTGGGMQAAAPIAIGFMTGIFANMAVRDPNAGEQLTTMLLLMFPPVASVSLASYLSAWPWLADLVFVIVVTVAALARVARPRGMALAMVGFIGYFIGVILHPPLFVLPHLAIAVGIAVGVAALVRFAIIRDDPDAALRHVNGHLARRVDRILERADLLLADGPHSPSESGTHRSHYEIARLNDALIAAVDQLDRVGAGEDEHRHLSDSFFRLELAAERLMRLVARRPDRPDTAAARRRIAGLRRAIAAGTVTLPSGGGRDEGQALLAALDGLQSALAEVLATGSGPAAGSGRP